MEAAAVDDPLSSAPGTAGQAAAAPVVGLPAAGCAPRTHAPAAGEGILTLTLAAPGTDWANPTNTSLVVDASVDGRIPQEIVLFNGGDPFSYQGFLGDTSVGLHCVTVSLRRDISHESMVNPAVRVYGVGLSVVPPSSPAYLLESHAPVLYGRSISAKGDTPLITYGQAQPDPDKIDTDVSYTIVWTHEDVGDGMVPAYEWGHWGRMTDIETVIHEVVAPGGKVLSATYLSCGCEAIPGYPDSSPEHSAGGGETYKPYPTSGTAAGLGDHIGIRDATGNNDMSPSGNTPFRFQQSLVAAPAPGQAREVATDDNPWTYRISGKEVAREATSSTDPRSILAGVYPQYLIVDIDATALNTYSIAIEVRLSGDPTWYSNDYSQATAPNPPTTYPFFNGGHGRTAIKLPLNWNGRAIDGLRLRLNALPGTSPSLDGTPVIELVEVTPVYAIEHPAFPAPGVVTGTEYPPA